MPRAPGTSSVLSSIGIALCLATCSVPARGAECRSRTEDGPRTLILALDGVPYRVVERAREAGAFAGWPATGRLIASFPSVTNVVFTEMLQPAGVGPAPGYEYAHFDYERNAKVNASPFHYKRRSFAWRDEFDSIGRSLGSKLAVYTRPLKKSRKELEQAEHALFTSPDDLVLVHVGSTDALEHLHGDDATLEVVLGLDRWLSDLRMRHEQRLGRPLSVVLLSDHGNTHGKIRSATGFKRRLRGAGLRVTNRIERDNDVVATTFGLVGYGALFLAPQHAEPAARAVADHPGVAFAVWIARPGVLRVVSRDGTAAIRWRGDGSDLRFAYEPGDGDPLRLIDVVDALAADGRLDREGFARDHDWFRYTSFAEYPDAPYRLLQALTGDHLLNHASVLFSLRPGRSWGWKSARAGSWLRSGHLEGTHGGLDRESSVGFFLTDSREHMPPGGTVRASDALRDYLGSRDDLACSGFDVPAVERRRKAESVAASAAAAAAR